MLVFEYAENHIAYQGKLKEVTQIGCELIHDDTSDADAELIALTIESQRSFLVSFCA